MNNSLVLSFLLSFVAFGSVVSAQPVPTDIEALHQEGNNLRHQHRDEDARVIFQRLWERTHEARALARLALAEESLGRHPEAEAHMTEALGLTSDQWIQQNRAVLEGALQQIRAAQGVSVLTVVSNVPGALVFLYGARVGSMDAPIRTSPGAVNFEVRAAGYSTVNRTATMTPGNVTRVEVSLGFSGAPPTAPTATVSPTASVVSGVTATITTSTRPSGGIGRTLAFVSAAGALVFIVVGTVGYLLGSPAATRWNDDGQCLRPYMTREQVCGSDGATAESMGALAAVGFIAGAALAATSLVLFALPRSGRGSEAQARSALACGAGPGELGVACAGRF